LRVPSEYPTINAGLDAAAFGDTVLVAPGTYREADTRGPTCLGTVTSVAFLKDGVVLLSEAGPEHTTLSLGWADGDGEDVVVLACNLPSEDTVLEGFLVTGAPYGSSGMQVWGCGQVTVRGCAFRNLDAGAVSPDDLYGGGIFSYNSSLVVEHCEFQRCLAEFGGGVCYHAHFAVARSLRIASSIFRDCQARGGGGAVATWGDAQAPVSFVVTDCVFGRNEADNGGAVSLRSSLATVQLEENRFAANRSRTGGAAVVAGGQSTIGGNLFVGDGGGSGALRVGAGLHTVSGNTFHRADGHALAVGPTACADIVRNVFSAGTGGPALVVFEGAVVGTHGCNLFHDNAGGAVSGLVLDATNVFADPSFCAPAAGDFHVAADSPCLPEHSNGCGRIGALGVGCGPVSIRTETWARIKSRYR
jgi:hypothetical protein